MPPADPDHALRLAAHDYVRRLQRAFDDLIPRQVLLEGFPFDGQQVSYGSFQRGIHRSRQQRGPAALTLFTSPNSPYDDEIDEESGAIVYAYRAGTLTQADNRALDAAFEMQVPLIYIKGIDPGQYTVVQPVFVTDRDPRWRVRSARDPACPCRTWPRPGPDVRPNHTVSPRCERSSSALTSIDFGAKCCAPTENGAQSAPSTNGTRPGRPHRRVC